MCGHSFHPGARNDLVPRGPRFWRNGRVGFRFLVYTISKNALEGDQWFARRRTQRNRTPAGCF
jgi:hypothetical protein